MHTPYTRIIVRKSKTVAITAGGHICVFESSTGRTLSSTAELSGFKPSPVVSAVVFGKEGEYLATVSEDKNLKIWKMDDLSLVNERTAVKKPTHLQVTKKDSSLLISDKFGDVYSFSFDLPEATSSRSEGTEFVKRTTTTSLESLGGKLLMGHVSLLTTFVLSEDEKFIITADRDEHIRVSWYPESYVIESFCLGQKKFVSALHIPSWDPSQLLSGGGDPEIRLWNWMEGKLIAEYDIGDTVLPFIKIVRHRRGDGDESGDEGEESGQPKKPLTKAQKRKLKKKGKEQEAPIDTVAQKEGGDANDMEVDEETTTPARASSIPTADDNTAEPLLAVSKIRSLELNSHRLCLFSALGATALFYFEVPKTPSDAEVVIRNCDLNKPVLDFFVVDESGEVWVLTDGECNDASMSSMEPSPMVRVLRLEDSGLVEAEICTQPELLNALNSSNILTSSTETTDLYSSLTSLPKHARDDAFGADDGSEVQEPSKRAKGRMKAQLAREAVASKRDSDKADIQSSERDTKKLKNES